MQLANASAVVMYVTGIFSGAGKRLWIEYIL
jgi:hypothetical protein